MKDNRDRYQARWTFLRWLAGGTLRRVFAFEGEAAAVDAEPFLLVANHNTDLDPALIGLSFPQCLTFVASEHAFRKGFASRLLTSCFRTISRMKGDADASAAMHILRTLKRGENVCLFAEGNRSFNGVTCPIFPATGKLAKASGATLVTYKFEGGYLTSPRWSHTLRRGRMLGYVVNVYPPEKLKAMTAGEVNEAIRADLHEDAFERQATEEAPVAYRGKALAEGLENALYLCPRCGRIGTLSGKGNAFSCAACGLTSTYSVYGTFEGAEKPFDNVRDWDAWQTTRVAQIAADAGDEPLFSDEGMRLMHIGAEHESVLEAEGTLSMTAKELTIGTRVFPLSDITDMAQVGASRVLFSVDGAHYEIASNAPRYCGRKYVAFFKLLSK